MRKRFVPERFGPVMFVCSWPPLRRTNGNKLLPFFKAQIRGVSCALQNRRNSSPTPCQCHRTQCQMASAVVNGFCSGGRLLARPTCGRFGLFEYMQIRVTAEEIDDDSWPPRPVLRNDNHRAASAVSAVAAFTSSCPPRVRHPSSRRHRLKG